MYVKLFSIAVGYDGKVDTIYGVDRFGQAYVYEVGPTLEASGWRKLSMRILEEAPEELVLEEEA